MSPLFLIFRRAFKKMAGRPFFVEMPRHQKVGIESLQFPPDPRAGGPPSQSPFVIGHGRFCACFLCFSFLSDGTYLDMHGTLFPYM